MGRFFLTLVLALAIFGGAAWYLNLFGTSEKPGDSGLTNPGGGKVAPKRELGGPLYAAVNPKELPPLDDEPPVPLGQFRREPIVVSDCHMTPIEKRDIASPKDGVILFDGKQIYEQDTLKGDTLPTVCVKVGDQNKYIVFQRWDLTDIVNEGDVLALVDPGKALNDRLYKRAKIVAAQADYKAAIFMAREAQARLDRLDQLRRTGGYKVVPEEDYAAAVLTRDKHHQEELNKKEQVNISVIEFQQSEFELGQHYLKNPLIGKSRIKTIYKNAGEGVKNLEPVMQLENLSRLRAEGSAEPRFATHLFKGKKVIIEPSEDLNPEPLLKAHSAEINAVAVAFSKKQPNNPRVVSASEDRTVAVWQRDRTQAALLPLGAPVRSLACSPAGAERCLCLAGTSDGRIFIWDLDAEKGPKLLYEIKSAHQEAVSALAFSPDGKWFASGGVDNAIHLWDTASGKEVEHGGEKYTFENPHQGAVTALQFTPQGRLVSAARDNTLRVWELHAKGARLLAEPLLNRGGNVAFPGVSADGRLMIFDQGRDLVIRGVEDQVRKARPLSNPASSTPFETLALFSPDASLILTAGAADGRMQLWRAPTVSSRAYELRQLVTGERSPVTCAAFAPNGAFAVSGSKDGHLYVWPIPDRATLLAHRIHADPQGRPLVLTQVDQSLDAGRIRIGVNVENPETAQYPNGRLIPGQRVTLVVEP